MSISDAVKTVLSKYATFTGRAGRSEFWLWILAYIIALLVVGTLDGAIVAPFIGALILIYWYAQPSQIGTNRYGESV